MARVVRARRTEVLDADTCENCRKLDGLVKSVGDPDFHMVKPPWGCSHGNRCRGTLEFYLDDADAQDEKDREGVP